MHDDLAICGSVAIALADAEARITFADFNIDRNDGCGTCSLDPRIEDVFTAEEMTPALRAAYPTALATCRAPGISEAERREWLHRYAPAIAEGAAYQQPRTLANVRTTVALSSVDTADADVGRDGDPAAAPVFPEAAWRGPFADYRVAMDGTTEAPDCFHFAALWAGVAGRLRRRVHVHYSETLYPNPYLVTFGTTGDTKKTSGMRKILPLLPPERVKVLRGVGSAEALGDWMQQPEDGPRVAHLLHIEELASLLTRGRWDGSTLISFLTETFDTPPIYEVPFRNNAVKLVEPTPILLAGTTAEWFWKSLRDVDIHGGFGNRLFFLTGTPKAPIPLPKKPDAACLDRVRIALDALDNVPPGETTLTPEAQSVWVAFYTAWRGTRIDPLVSAMTKRTPTYVMKLALVYAALEGTSPAITGDQMAAAILVGRFGVACAEWLVAGRRGTSAQGCCEDAVVHAIRTVDLPAWKIHQRIGGRFSAEELTRALRALMATGAVIEVGKTRRREPIYGLRGRYREA